MKRFTTRLWTPEEYQYTSGCGFIPKLDAYLHEDDEVRPCIVVAPGGGYMKCSPSEGEPVALKFYEMGYQAFVCSYTVNFLEVEPIKKRALNDLARAVRMIRKNAEEYHVDAERIVAAGFSAGGHCVASLGVHWQDVTDVRDEYADISCRPDAVILGYPVIDLHADMDVRDRMYGTGRNLVGEDAPEEEKTYMCLENHVTELCPPAFIWQTVTDEVISVRNSMVFAESCRKAGVKFALHLFSDGRHGLSVADETANTTVSNYYTFEPFMMGLEAYERGELDIPQDKLEKFLNSPEVYTVKNIDTIVKPSKDHDEVKKWVGLAENWLELLWKR
ncbi:MAG: alpha/beta hydrolase [Lachnospiraceae bacterium]|nr:alpha/beta hydrolase [Lachnospiraceae bacterium]